MVFFHKKNVDKSGKEHNLSQTQQDSIVYGNISGNLNNFPSNSVKVEMENIINYEN